MKEKQMKKFLMAALIGLLPIPNLVFANDVRVIPYPNGLDIKSEGASAAPQEITHKASPYFNMPDVFELTSNDHLTILTHYPTYQQTTEYSCGPADALTILWYYGKNDVTEKELIEKMGASFETGTTVKGIANYFNSLGWNVKTNLEGKSFDDYEEFADFVQEELKSWHPIMVENVFMGGHWRVIIGYDTMGTQTIADDVLIFADTYDTADHNQDGYSIENGENFFWTWFDYQVLPENERKQPFVVAYPTKTDEL